MRTLRFLLLTGMVVAGCGTRGGGGGGSLDAGPARDTGPGTDAGPARDSGGPGLDAGPPSCPPSPPVLGASCDAPARCTYDRCATSGDVIRATCGEGADGWTLSMDGCEPFACEGGAGSAEQCEPQAVCVVRSGGALFVECSPNPCGEGPITAACACELCSSGFTCTVDDRTVYCTSTCTDCP